MSNSFIVFMAQWLQISFERSFYDLQELSDKIAQLNAAIDEVSSQMKAKDPKPEPVVEEITI